MMTGERLLNLFIAALFLHLLYFKRLYAESSLPASSLPAESFCNNLLEQRSENGIEFSYAAFLWRLLTRKR
jgi:hypothetical protein